MTHRTDANPREFSKPFIQRDGKFGDLYIKEMRNTAKIRTRTTEGPAKYDLSATEGIVVPAKGKSVVKTTLSKEALNGVMGT